MATPATCIRNPRRSGRARVSCSATVISAVGVFQAETEDVGAHGCRLASPRLVQRGQPILLTVAHSQVRESLRVAGRIAWTSDVAPWRLGIAFDTGALVKAERWFSVLLAAVPACSVDRRVPDSIALSSVLFLGPPPRLVIDLTAEDLALLELVGAGTPLLSLRERLGERWPAMERVLFSLLAHRYVTLSRGASVHPNAWAPLLRRRGAATEAPQPPQLPMIPPERWSSGSHPAPRGAAVARGGRSRTSQVDRSGSSSQ